MRRTSLHVSRDHVRNYRLIKLMVGLLCIVIAFVAGFFLRGQDVVLERLGMSPTTSADDINPGMTVSGSTFNSLSARIAEVQGLLSKESMDDYDLDAATAEVLGTLSSSTGDSYVHYYDQAHYETYLKDVTASYAGVGILFSEKTGAAYALDVFSGSEAESLGVQSGDYVIAIDGDRGNGGWTAAEVIKSVTREAGSSVVLTFRRPETPDAEGGSEFTVTLTCTNYAEPNVVSELSGTVGYIKLSQITSNADSLVSSAISSLTQQGARSFVLDLRDNPGGYVTQAVDVASLFVKSGVAVQINTRVAQSNRTFTGTVATDLPLVVLVNGNTASTAEVLAGALQDNKRATVVGEQTLGKGSVQSIRELSFGGALRFTSAYYLTPLGHSIDGSGIAPDVIVRASEDPSVDAQRNLAIETAQALQQV